jgi:hypothetical protein
MRPHCCPKQDAVGYFGCSLGARQSVKFSLAAIIPDTCLGSLPALNQQSAASYSSYKVAPVDRSYRC